MAVWCMIFSISIIYSISASCIWSIQHVYDQNNMHFTHSCCVWSIWTVYDPFTRYLIDLTCIWLVLPGVDQFDLDMVGSTCFGLIAPVLGQCNQGMGYYAWFCLMQGIASCIWLIQPAQNLVILFLFELTCLLFNSTCIQLIQHVFNQFYVYSVDSTCI